MSTPKLVFDVLFDDSFVNINLDKTLKPINNKRVLSLLNDFESGKWRFDKFQNFIWDNIKETGLSAKEREVLIGDGESSVLSFAAKNLRLTDSDVDPSRGSELAEIALYGIMKRHYGALPVVPKIFYKQNQNDPVKGADSVHIVIEGDSDFSLWFGEAKFYNSIEDTRLGEVVTSVANMLNSDKIKKENSIITNLKDLELLIQNEALKTEIINRLDRRKSIDDLINKIQIPIFLLYECDITKGETSLSETYKNSVINYHKDRAQSYFKKQIDKISKVVSKYEEIRFHIILFPVPDKKKIVDSFIQKAQGHLKP